MEEFVTKWLNNKLNEFGFSEAAIKERICCMNRSSNARNISNKQILGKDHIEKFFVGSQREGTGISYDSDLDIMQVNTAVKCHETIPQNLNERHVHFHMETENTPNGYCYLSLLDNLGSVDEVDFALDGPYLSSAKYLSKNEDAFYKANGYIGKNTIYLDSQGPSIPKYVEEPILIKILCKWTGNKSVFQQKMDFVKALICNCPLIIKAWSTRERKYDWPSKETIDLAASQQAHVVPTGKSGSENQDFQWRICFTLSEIILIQSFNNTQTKVYVLLKLIAKHFLHPECPFITSYVMKNVILWQAESMPASAFQPSTLLERLRDCLTFLKECVGNKQLPCYMIPDRNLFCGKCEPTMCDKVKSKLSYLLEHGISLTKGIADGFTTGDYEKFEFNIRMCLSAENVQCKWQRMKNDEELVDYFMKMFYQSSIVNNIYHFREYILSYSPDVPLELTDYPNENDSNDKEEEAKEKMKLEPDQSNDKDQDNRNMTNEENKTKLYFDLQGQHVNILTTNDEEPDITDPIQEQMETKVDSNSQKATITQQGDIIKNKKRHKERKMLTSTIIPIKFNNFKQEDNKKVHVKRNKTSNIKLELIVRKKGLYSKSQVRDTPLSERSVKSRSNKNKRKHTTRRERRESESRTRWTIHINNSRDTYDILTEAIDFILNFLFCYISLCYIKKFLPDLVRAVM